MANRIIFLFFVVCTVRAPSPTCGGLLQLFYKTNTILSKGMKWEVSGGSLAFDSTYGRFEIHDNNGVLKWKTEHGHGLYAKFQDDGNFVIYGWGGAAWSSGTIEEGKRGSMLVFQKDRNLVIYDGNDNAVWDSNTDTSWYEF